MSPVGTLHPGFLIAASTLVPGESEGITGGIHVPCHMSVILLNHLAGSSIQPMAGCYKPCSLNTPNLEN